MLKIVNSLANNINLIEKNLTLQNFSKVERYAGKLIKKGVNDLWLLNVLAISLAKQNKFLRASKCFHSILALDPEGYNSHFNLARLFHDKGDDEKVIEFCSKSLKMHPDHLGSINLLVIINLKKGNLSKSLIEKQLNIAKKILIKDPINKLALKCISHSLAELGDYKAALNTLNKLEQNYGYNPKLYNDLGTCLIELGRYSEARDKLFLSETNLGKYNLGMLDFKEGNYKDGWLGYEFGLKENIRKIKNLSKKFDVLPQWKIEKTAGPLLIIGEQGLGDEIMFSTMFPEIIKKVNSIYLITDKRLHGLFSRTYPEINIIKDQDLFDIKKLNFRIAMGSLGKFFRQTREDFFYSEKRLLKPLNSSINALKSKYNFDKKKLYIGLSWHTTNLSHGSRRNIKLAEIVKAFKELNVSFINLQYGDHTHEIKQASNKFKKEIFLSEEGDNKSDIDILAAKISLCDYVVSIDNSTAHLAGSLGVNTLLILPEVSDWRWQVRGKDSLWYNSIRLFRNNSKFNWNETLEELKNYILNSNLD